MLFCFVLLCSSSLPPLLLLLPIKEEETMKVVANMEVSLKFPVGKKFVAVTFHLREGDDLTQVFFFFPFFLFSPFLLVFFFFSFSFISSFHRSCFQILKPLLSSPTPLLISLLLFSRLFKTLLPTKKSPVI